MRHYEIVFLVHPDQSSQVPAMIDRYNEMVSSGSGITHRVEDWGRRKLAYMINDVHKAHYVMINIECGLDVLAEIEKNFKFNDSILRHLVIRRKKAETEESPMAKAKAQEDAEEAAKLVREEERSKNDDSDDSNDLGDSGDFDEVNDAKTDENEAGENEVGQDETGQDEMGGADVNESEVMEQNSPVEAENIDDTELEDSDSEQVEK